METFNIWSVMIFELLNAYAMLWTIPAVIKWKYI